MSKIILEAQDIKRTLSRISHEIVENVANLDDLVLVGIKSRGADLALRIKENIQQFEGVEVEWATIDITHFRDDVAKKDQINVDTTGLTVEVDKKIIVLVDDVLYTGRTIRAAMDALIVRGRPAMIKLAILIDRGHRELPIRADFVGKNIPTSRAEKVSVYINEVDNKEYVEIS